MVDLFSEYAAGLNLIFGLVAAIAVGVGMYISIRKYRMDRRKDNQEQRTYFSSQLSASEARIKEVVSLKIENVDNKIETIQDVLSTHAKQARDLDATIDALGKDINELQKKVLVLEIKIPEVDRLKDAFYKLKTTFDTYMAMSKSSKLFEKWEKEAMDEDMK